MASWPMGDVKGVARGGCRGSVSFRGHPGFARFPGALPLSGSLACGCGSHQARPPHIAPGPTSPRRPLPAKPGPSTPSRLPVNCIPCAASS